MEQSKNRPEVVIAQLDDWAMPNWIGEKQMLDGRIGQVSQLQRPRVQYSEHRLPLNVAGIGRYEIIECERIKADMHRCHGFGHEGHLKLLQRRTLVADLLQDIGGVMN